MVTENKNGYSINGIQLSCCEAYEIYRYLERKYYKSDVLDRLHDDYGEDVEQVVIANSELLEDMVRLYEKYRGNDDQWSYDLDEVMYEFEDTIKQIANNRYNSEN